MEKWENGIDSGGEHLKPIQDMRNRSILSTRAEGRKEEVVMPKGDFGVTQRGNPNFPPRNQYLGSGEKEKIQWTRLALRHLFQCEKKGWDKIHKGGGKHL